MIIGKHTIGAPEIISSDCSKNNKLIIGKYCSFGKHVKVSLGQKVSTDNVTMYPFDNTVKKMDPVTNSSVYIGNDVSIGDNVTIASGITIGDGSIIHANSHVTMSVKPYTEICGNQSRPINFRFTDTQISKMLSIRWWDWDDAKVTKFMKLLNTNDIDAFIKAATPVTKPSLPTPKK